MSSSSDVTARVWTWLVRPTRMPVSLSLVMVGLLVWTVVTTTATDSQMLVILLAMFAVGFVTKGIERSMDRHHPAAVAQRHELQHELDAMTLRRAAVHWARHYTQPLLYVVAAYVAAAYCIYLLLAG